MATETINVDMSTRNNSFSAFVNLAEYNNAYNRYTIPCDGYVTVNDTAAGGGHVYVYFPGSSTAIITGISGERQALFVKQGMTVYLNGTVTSARFYPLDRFA